MNLGRFEQITSQYSGRSIAIVGDFCLDRYLEIDPSRSEVSIETGLPVHNVIHVRSQPGGAGTILNNLVALGIKEIYAVGFAGQDGEGFELRRSLAERKGVVLRHFLSTELRRTFTYTKPLLVERGKAPVELNRLDFKNWEPTPKEVREHMREAVRALADQVDAFILLDQVDVADTGVMTPEVLAAVRGVAEQQRDLLIVADSRRSLRDYPPVCLKMNRAEFQALTGAEKELDITGMKELAIALAKKQSRFVFVTLAENGMLGASPKGEAAHVPALPVRGEIDIVGAGDAVTANLVAALSSGASLGEALELAMLAASIVVHQLGTTGTATVAQLEELHRESIRPR